MNKLYSRRFDVDFYEKDEKSWVVVCHLEDAPHDITAEVEVSVPGMDILDAKLRFDRYPIDCCPRIEENVRRLIGLNLLDPEYVASFRRILEGPEGCGNASKLLSIGLEALVYTYYPHLMRQGKMSGAEWMEFTLTRLRRACLGHTLLEEGKAQSMYRGAGR